MHQSEVVAVNRKRPTAVWLRSPPGPGRRSRVCGAWVVFVRALTPCPASDFGKESGNPLTMMLLPSTESLATPQLIIHKGVVASRTRLSARHAIPQGGPKGKSGPADRHSPSPH